MLQSDSVKSVLRAKDKLRNERVAQCSEQTFECVHDPPHTDCTEGSALQCYLVAYEVTDQNVLLLSLSTKNVVHNCKSVVEES